MIVSGVLITFSLILVALLVARTDFGEDLLSRAPSADPSPPSLLAVSDVTSFDPQGIGTPGEHEATVGNVIDADPSTTWNTETYPNRAFGNLKTGVGVALTLPEVRSLERIRVNSPSQDWAVEVYVADVAAPTLAGWGEPNARAEGVNGDIELDLNGATGAAVLVWITDLGSNDPLRVTISDIFLAG
jgi:hypothetical protein